MSFNESFGLNGNMWSVDNFFIINFACHSLKVSNIMKTMIKIYAKVRESNQSKHGRRRGSHRNQQQEVSKEAAKWQKEGKTRERSLLTCPQTTRNITKERYRRYQGGRTLKNLLIQSGLIFTKTPKFINKLPRCLKVVFIILICWVSWTEGFSFKEFTAYLLSNLVHNFVVTMYGTEHWRTSWSGFW